MEFYWLNAVSSFCMGSVVRTNFGPWKFSSSTEIIIDFFKWFHAQLRSLVLLINWVSLSVSSSVDYSNYIENCSSSILTVSASSPTIIARGSTKTKTKNRKCYESLFWIWFVIILKGKWPGGLEDKEVEQEVTYATMVLHLSKTTRQLVLLKLMTLDYNHKIASNRSLSHMY